MDIFSKEETQILNKQIKKFNFLSHREIQIKTTSRFYLVPIRAVIIKEMKNKNDNKSVGEVNLYLPSVEMHTRPAAVGISMAVPQRTKN